MQVSIADGSGFCFGVKRAVKIAFEEAGKKGGAVYTYGPIIHNPQVVGKLASEGVRHIEKIEDLGNLAPAAIIVRTHGVTQDEMRLLRQSGAEVIDATCPFVKKAQRYAKLLMQENYTVIILGDREHPEVRGLMSYAGDRAIVVRTADELPELEGKVGIVVQTTQQVKRLQELLVKVAGQCKEIKVYNTICNSTAERQRETKALAAGVDVMIIVGGRNSANTTQLASLCNDMDVRTYHIETSEELRPEWFEGALSVGISAGASTPEWIINEVYDRINDIGGMVN